jgi:hypothetical protein
MGKFLTIDDTFCYLSNQNKGIIYILKVQPINNQLQEEIKNEWGLFKDYLYTNPPWRTDPDRYKNEYKKYIERETEIFNFILSIYPNKEQEITKKKDISPGCLANFLESYCWLNGNYEAESLFISRGEFDYAIYESSNNFLFGRKRGARVVAFRYSEFKEISISMINGAQAFRLGSKVCSFNGRLDKKWKSIFLY